MFKKVRIDRTIKSKKVLYYLLFFVFAAISTLTIAYATLSSTLKITGSAEFEDASWNLVLEEYNDHPWDADFIGATRVDGNLIIFGEGQLLEEPTVVGTSLKDYKVSIGKIGDGVYLEYLLKNTGDVPALLESVTWTDPTITSSTNDQSDIELVREFFEPFPMIYTTAEEDGRLYPSGPVVQGSILCPGAAFEVRISNYFSTSAPRVPYSKVEVSDLSINFNFVATDQNLCDGSTPIEQENQG